MWRWSLAYTKMPPCIVCSMLCIAKTHQAFLCYKDNYQANFYWCPCPNLPRVMVLLPCCTFKVADDMNCCVNNTKRKYALDRPAIMEIWPSKVGTNFTINEIKYLEKVGFVLNKR